MRRFFIALNRYYNNYKTIIWIAILIIVLFLLINNAIDKFLRKNINSSNVNNITTIVAVNEGNLNYTNNISNTVIEKTDNEIVSEISDKEVAIKVFVDFCNSSKLDSAYGMLSEECKEILYPTKSDFVSNYYNVYFAEFKNVSINKYNGNSTYKVDFKLDSISTGQVNINTKTDYITVNSDYKLNVSSFIKKRKIDRVAKNSYLKVNVVNEYAFLDHEIYDIEVENFTSADIYLDDLYTSSSTFLVDKDNNYFYLDTNNYKDDELKVLAKKIKNVNLQFYRTYNENNEASEMLLNNIKVENYEYTDSNYISSNVIADTSQEIIYERKTTTYPDTVSLKVSLK